MEETLIRFRLKGRFAHFLKAESGVTALTYPVPPRTVIMGLVGAVLGLEKDGPQQLIGSIKVTIEGTLPMSHWHKVKLRKDPPNQLPHIIDSRQQGSANTRPEKATLIRQEWLFNPEYVIGVALPQPYQDELERRLQNRQWYYTPCLGLSELLADLDYIETVAVEKLPFGKHEIQGLIRQDQVKLDVAAMYEENLSIHMLRLPRQVTSDRVFTHAPYLFETIGRKVKLETDVAYGDGERAWMFL
ncbi:MAG: CRISPR-associated protein Cas5 [Syntrophomonadaceae bacterium]|jgi:CRISPR-associated protein Cas5h